MNMAQVNYWKLALWKGASGPIMAALAAVPTIALNWDTMTGQGRTVAIIGILITWYKAFDMYLDQTMSRLAQGLPLVQLPGMNGNASVHTETTAATTIVTDTIKPGPNINAILWLLILGCLITNLR